MTKLDARLECSTPYGPGIDRRRFLLTSLAGALAAPLAAGAKSLSPMLTITGTGQ
jgi:hypothetical protein